MINQLQQNCVNLSSTIQPLVKPQYSISASYKLSQRLLFPQSPFQTLTLTIEKTIVIVIVCLRETQLAPGSSTRFWLSQFLLK